MKKRSGKKRGEKITKGMSSAVLLSIAIHAALFFLAGLLVVFTVVKKKEVEFEPPQAMERPKMKLKKPKVKVRKSARPKRAKNIMAKPNPMNMPEIQLPEGVAGGLGQGLGDGIVGGFDLMPDMDEATVFGSGQSIGNDFVGTLYNLKRDRQGRNIPMGKEQFQAALRKFVLSGWKSANLSRYYCAPRKLYATHFMIPPLPSPMAPDVFGAPQMKSYYFMILYEGQLVSSEPITFRFWANGDAFMMIQVDGKDVLLDCWPDMRTVFDWWQSTSADTEKYYLGNKRMTVGDWITLEPGKPLDMKVMFGERTGGSLAAMLAVEVEGVEYPKNRQGGPILPAFKTSELSRDVLDEIRQYLPENEVCLTNGPVFRDYILPSAVESGGEDADNESTIMHEDQTPLDDDQETKVRIWTLEDGHSFKAEFVSLICSQVVLRNTKGKLIKIPPKQFRQQDWEYIQLEMPPDLDISFTKQSRSRVFPETLSPDLPNSTFYDFSVKIKQTSPQSYDKELQVDVYVVGAEITGQNYILLDRQKHRFVPTKEYQRLCVEGRSIELFDYLIGEAWLSQERQRRGLQYSSFLVVVTDLRGKIIAYKTSKEWLFENLDQLNQIPVGAYFDKSCSRVSPTPPKHFY